MVVLVLALYAEGSVDTRFLPIIIQRTSERILARYSLRIVDVPEVIIIPKKSDDLDKCILNAAQEAKNCHALLVHNDADQPTYTKTWEERFKPGFTLVQQSQSEICRNLIPVIPIYMIEAWMLADCQTLLRILGTNLNCQELDLPRRAALVENIAQPKERLNEAVHKINATRSRRQAIQLNTKYEALARQIDLSRLFEISAYKTFVSDLAKTLEKLHFISYGSSSQILANTHF